MCHAIEQIIAGIGFIGEYLNSTLAAAFSRIYFPALRGVLYCFTGTQSHIITQVIGTGRDFQIVEDRAELILIHCGHDTITSTVVLERPDRQRHIKLTRLVQRSGKYREEILAFTGDKIVAEIGNVLADIVAPRRSE